MVEVSHTQLQKGVTLVEECQLVLNQTSAQGRNLLHLLGLCPQKHLKYASMHLLVTSVCHLFVGDRQCYILIEFLMV